MAIDLLPVQILEAKAIDMPRIFEITSLAFARNEPYWDLIWPQHWTENGRQAGSERMRKSQKSNRNSAYIKAVDEKTREVVGMAIWEIYSSDCGDELELEEINILPENFAASDHHRLAAIAMKRCFLRDRHDAIRRTKGNLVCLDVLAVDPAYHKRGIGDALVRWGTVKADQLGAETVVEASVVGRGVYERNGFKVVAEVVVDVPEACKGFEIPAELHTWMVRPKKG